MDIFDIKKDVCNITHEGKVRPKNEDNQGYTYTSNGHIFVVCDGMGGHVGGQVASNIAVESIIEYFASDKKPDIYVAMCEAIEYANRNIYERSRQDTSLEGMGTTAVLLVIQNENSYIAHVGDSRIYLHTSGQLHRVTKDHSYVQSLVDNGTISDDDAERHPRKNELMRALGISPKVKVEVASQPIRTKNGDTFLLCSDGLNGMVNDMTMEATLNKTLSIQQKGEELLQFALNAGGKDNITLSLIEISKSPNPKTYFISKSPERKEIPVTNPDIKYTKTLDGSEFGEIDTQKTENLLNINNQQQELPLKNEIAKDTINKDNKKKKTFFMLLGGVAFVLLLIVGLYVTGIIGSKPYQVLILKEKGKFELGNFATLDEAKEEARNYMDEKNLKGKFEIWYIKNKFANLEFEEDPNSTVISTESGDSKTSLTQNNKKVLMPEGIGWKALYEEYGVCKCYIIEVNDPKLFGKNNSLKANTSYIIPLDYSSKEEYNPKNYQKYLPEKVGYDNNGDCSKIGKQCGGTSATNSTKVTDNKTETTTEEKKDDKTVTDDKTDTKIEEKKEETKKELTYEEKKAAAKKDYDEAFTKYEAAKKVTITAEAEYKKISETNFPIIKEEKKKTEKKQDAEKIERLNNEISIASKKLKDAQTAEKTAKANLDKAKIELEKYK